MWRILTHCIPSGASPSRALDGCRATGAYGSSCGGRPTNGSGGGRPKVAGACPQGPAPYARLLLRHSGVRRPSAATAQRGLRGRRVTYSGLVTPARLRKQEDHNFSSVRCRGQPAVGGSRVIPAPPVGALGRRAGLSEPARAAATAFYRAHHSERSEFVPSEEASACAPHPDPRRTAAGLMGGGGRLLANPVRGVEHDGRARCPGGVGLGLTALVGAGGPRPLAAILRRRTGLPGSRGCWGWAGSRRAGQADGRGSAPQPAAKRCRDSVWRVATLRACGHGGRARLWTGSAPVCYGFSCGLAPGSVCTVQ